MSTTGWRPEYSTGVAAMDQQHRQLFVMLENLHASMQSGRRSARKATEDSLAGLLDYAQTHFHDEEELMRRFLYPGLPEHIRQHGELVDKLVAKVKRFEDHSLTTTRLALFIRDWIVQHLIEEDLKYGAYFKKRKMR